MVAHLPLVSILNRDSILLDRNSPIPNVLAVIAKLRSRCLFAIPTDDTAPAFKNFVMNIGLEGTDIYVCKRPIRCFGREWDVDAILKVMARQRSRNFV